MTAKIPDMPQKLLKDALLTRSEIRQYDDADLLQLVVFTDAVMCHRLLTDTEIHNFWLAVDERRERER